MTTIVAAILCLAAPQTVPLDLAEGWSAKTQGPWRVRYDHRALLAMFHPWQDSAEGNFASVSREITVPGDWQGPVFLTFYCSDDYHTDLWRPDGSWLTAEGFIGHRLKQVLLDDRVVWSSDVSDPVPKGTPPPVKVELPLKPGGKGLLTLLVFDAVPSTTFTDKDFYQSSNNAKERKDDPDAAKFQTHVYWGDVSLVNTELEVKNGVRPTEKEVREVHTKRWPLPPFGDSWDKPIELEVSAPEGIPKQGFPARCGVPLASGKAKNVDRLSLRGEKGPVASQKSALGTWPDDSLQWVLFDFPVQPGMSALRLALDSEGPSFGAKTSSKELENGIAVDAKAVQLEARSGELLSNIRLNGAAKVASVGLLLELEGEEAVGTTESVSVVEDGPFRHTLELAGRFDSLNGHLGSFRLLCSSFLNMPYVACWLRVFNDTAKDLPVAGLKVRFTLPSKPEGLRVPSGEAQDGVVVRQVSEKVREVDGAPVDATPPMFVAWKDGAITVRQFRELFPKQASVKDNEIVFDLVAAGKSPVVFTPGEAKSHEIWLALGDVDPVQLAATVNKPPILQNAAYFCATGVLGLAAPHKGVPVLDEHMVNDFGKKQWEDFGQQFGVRDFPDSAYHGGLPKWCNNYYERMLGLWSEWFLSGDRAWYDLAEDVSRHLMDVAIVHSEVPGHDWLGAIHGPGDNHVSGPWSPNLRIAGLALYQKLTGDPDAREAFLGVAEFCLRSHAGLDSPSVRDHAGPFDAICTAYLDTADVKYLDDGAARVKAVLERMDFRRGAWPETHGCMTHKGNVPWMIAQLGWPLYQWYRATGDVQAAQALVGLAESIVCENTDWDRPGTVSGYSHNPHFGASATYDLLIIPIIFAAYELTEDPFFLESAKAQWERWTREKAFDSPLNCYWNTPWLVWYLGRYK